MEHILRVLDEKIAELEEKAKDRDWWRDQYLQIEKELNELKEQNNETL